MNLLTVSFALLLTCAQSEAQTPILSVDNSGIVNEGSSLEVCVEYSSAPSTEVTIELFTRDGGDGGAKGGSDFVSISDNLTFNSAGNPLRQCVSIEILLDSVLEDLQIFEVVATSNGVTHIQGSPANGIIISSDTFTVGFSEQFYNINEDEGGDICVVITEGGIERQIEGEVIRVLFAEGTATIADGDFDPDLISDLLTFDSNTPPEGVCFPAPIIADSIVEDTESFTVTIESNPDVNSDPVTRFATVFIQNDDAACSAPPSLENGIFILSSESLPSSRGDTAFYSCNVGFNLVGDSLLTCEVGNFWSPPTPGECVLQQTCPVLLAPLNGTVEQPSTAIAGQSASFTCDEGFNLEGSNVRFCRSIGSWTGVDTTCTPVDCLTLSPPTNGDIFFTMTTFTSTATYTCNAGYQLSGDTIRTCQADGMWSGSPPTCDPVDCGFLTAPENGQVSLPSTTFGNTAIYSCDTGFRLVGSPTRTCEADGIWSPVTAPTCLIIDCEAPSVPPNGQVDTSNGTIFGSMATYSCDPGYTLSGSSTRMCGTDKLWSPEQPACLAVDCGSLTAPDNGQVDTSSGTTFGSTATYTCVTGFRLIGSSTRTCEVEGLWDGSEPSCAIFDCGALDSLDSEITFTNGTTFGSQAIYSCCTVAGSRTCGSDGLWTLSEPTCQTPSQVVPVNTNQDIGGVVASVIAVAWFLISLVIFALLSVYIISLKRQLKVQGKSGDSDDHYETVVSTTNRGYIDESSDLEYEDIDGLRERINTLEKEPLPGERANTLDQQPLPEPADYELTNCPAYKQVKKNSRQD